jgi:hypothetical protein
VTLVVKRSTDKNPATFTIPATKDKSDAIRKLCFKVIDLPCCLKIFYVIFKMKSEPYT